MADITVLDSIKTEWPAPDMAELGRYILKCIWDVIWPALAIWLPFLLASRALG